ncbi:MAG TPA: hypothetical protein PLP19_09250 [bacterium]|nr:hypothetical protein [bacterium]HPN43662.1 hypothetical protein [bacterium]
MQYKSLPDWQKYWAKIIDIQHLQNKSRQIDETLKAIEKEFNCKLMSGDQLMIIEALEERIEQLKNDKNIKPGLQGELFE